MENQSATGGDPEAMADSRHMAIALYANLSMFLVGLVGWQVAQSTGLLADAFDMLADASGYLMARMALGRSEIFQKRAARWNGVMLILVGLLVIAEVALRWMGGSDPQGYAIMAFALASLMVNGGVLSMLRGYRHSPKVHLRATFIDTRADLMVNVSVLLSGAAIAATGWAIIDLLAGLAISLYVIWEGIEIWNEAGSES